MIHPNLKVTFNKDFEKVANSEFVAGTALIAYTDKNRNKSNIPEEAFVDAMPSLSLIPVVGHWIDTKQNFGGHDVTVEWNGNDLVLKDNTIPYGVVRENHNAEFVEIEENGVNHKYLKADVILWYGRFPEQIQKVIDDGANQSMEVNVFEVEDGENGYFTINKFEYSALCLLGRDIDEDGNKGSDNVEPCFESSSVVVDKFNMTDDFKLRYNELLSEMKTQFIKKENIEVVEDLNLDIENFATGEDETEDKVLESFATTYKQKRCAIENALDPIVVKGEEDEVISETYYWLDDFDETYAMVERSTWTVDNYECDYGRFSYSFDEEAISATINGEFEKLIKTALTQEEYDKVMSERGQMEADFAEMQSKLTEMESSIAELQSYKNGVETNIKKSEIEEIIEEFAEVLNENEEFEAIKEIAMDYEVEDLRKELYALEGKVKHSKETSKAKKPEKFTAKLSAETEKPATSYYGDAKKYLEQK